MWTVIGNVVFVLSISVSLKFQMKSAYCSVRCLWYYYSRNENGQVFVIFLLHIRRIC